MQKGHRVTAIIKVFSFKLFIIMSWLIEILGIAEKCLKTVQKGSKETCLKNFIVSSPILAHELEETLQINIWI